MLNLVGCYVIFNKPMIIVVHVFGGNLNSLPNQRVWAPIVPIQFQD
jgi:hypothetical protein